jgi:hypothetical protein
MVSGSALMVSCRGGVTGGVKSTRHVPSDLWHTPEPSARRPAPARGLRGEQRALHEARWATVSLFKR